MCVIHLIARPSSAKAWFSQTSERNVQLARKKISTNVNVPLTFPLQHTHRLVYITLTIPLTLLQTHTNHYVIFLFFFFFCWIATKQIGSHNIYIYIDQRHTITLIDLFGTLSFTHLVRHNWDITYLLFYYHLLFHSHEATNQISLYNLLAN